MKRKVAASSASFDSALEKAFLCLSQLGMARKLRTEQTKGKTEQIQLDVAQRFLRSLRRLLAETKPDNNKQQRQKDKDTSTRIGKDRYG